MHAQVEPHEQHPHDSAWQRGTYPHPSRPQPLRHLAPQELPTSHCVDNHSALHAAPRARIECVGHFIRGAADIPNVKLQMTAALGRVDIGQQLFENPLPRAEQLDVIARDRRQTDRSLEELRNRLKLLRQSRPWKRAPSRHCREPFFHWLDQLDISPAAFPPQPQFAD